MKITIVISSEGKNLELSKKISEALGRHGAEVTTVNLLELSLPLYTSRSEALHQAAALIAPLKETLAVDGFVFLAPEYNGSAPPVFSNFIAWVSRSTKNWRETFNGKPALIGTYSAGHGSGVLTSMRLQLSYIGMNVLGRQVQTGLHKEVDPAYLEATCAELLRLAGK